MSVLCIFLPRALNYIQSKGARRGYFHWREEEVRHSCSAKGHEVSMIKGRDMPRSYYLHGI